MILMPQIFDVTTNENERYKRNELELIFALERTIVVKPMVCNGHLPGQQTPCMKIGVIYLWENS